MNFCRRCGASLEHSQDHVFRCKNSHVMYANAAPTVGILFIDDDNDVLLSRRGIEPHKGMLDTFGGFLDGNESLEEAATRELKEELSLQPDEYESLRYLCSHGTTYKFGGETIPITSTIFWTRLKTDRSLTPSDDVAEIVRMPLFEIDFDELHEDDIRAGVKALQEYVARRGNG